MCVLLFVYTRYSEFKKRNDEQDVFAFGIATDWEREIQISAKKRKKRWTSSAFRVQLENRQMAVNKRDGLRFKEIKFVRTTYADRNACTDFSCCVVLETDQQTRFFLPYWHEQTTRQITRPTEKSNILAYNTYIVNLTCTYISTCSTMTQTSSFKSKRRKEEGRGERDGICTYRVSWTSYWTCTIGNCLRAASFYLFLLHPDFLPAWPFFLFFRTCNKRKRGKYFIFFFKFMAVSSLR